MAQPNWEAMLTAWKAMVAKPKNTALKAIEKNGNWLSRQLQEIKAADAKFHSVNLKSYQDFCLRLDLLISSCKDIAEHYLKGLPEAVKFVNGVGQAAKDRKTSAKLAVDTAIASLKRMGDVILKQLIVAGNDRAKASVSWLRIADLIRAGEGEGFPKLNDTRGAILKMPLPNDKASKLTMHDYQAAISNFMQATDHVF